VREREYVELFPCGGRHVRRCKDDPDLCASLGDRTMAEKCGEQTTPSWKMAASFGMGTVNRLLRAQSASRLQQISYVTRRTAGAQREGGCCVRTGPSISGVARARVQISGSLAQRALRLQHLLSICNINARGYQDRRSFAFARGCRRRPGYRARSWPERRSWRSPCKRNKKRADEDPPDTVRLEREREREREGGGEPYASTAGYCAMTLDRRISYR
jgi:hypothetical protein